MLSEYQMLYAVTSLHCPKNVLSRTLVKEQGRGHPAGIPLGEGAPLTTGIYFKVFKEKKIHTDTDEAALIKSRSRAGSCMFVVQLLSCV